MRLDLDFYAQPTIDVAQNLLGMLLVREQDQNRTSGLIVEVEAYLASDDRASHSFRGPTPRNRSMYLRAGCLYVYSIHAKFCMNVVTEPRGVGAAVLIRAVEPVEGTEVMRTRRGLACPPRDLTRGPARTCQAFAVDRDLDGTDLLVSDDIWIERPSADISSSELPVQRSTRIGISQDQDKKLRFFVDGNRFVSGCSRCHARPNRASILQHHAT